jgi:type I site-specific restriction endonuclease
MTTPEARARQNIDAQLTACGWVVQGRADMNLYAGRGVAVSEFPLETGYADYLLFVDRKAVGGLEAKSERLVLDWHKHQQTRATVQLEIQKTWINSQMFLPRCYLTRNARLYTKMYTTLIMERVEAFMHHE